MRQTSRTAIVWLLLAAALVLWPVGALAQEAGDAGAGQSPPGTAASQADPGLTAAKVAAVTIFVLAIFVGFEIITKVPPTLHTPLMSGSNAISGITLVGAVVVAAGAAGWSAWVGLLAVVLAAVNAVGGFLVTHRMLEMFQRKKR